MIVNTYIHLPRIASHHLLSENDFDVILIKLCDGEDNWQSISCV